MQFGAGTSANWEGTSVKIEKSNFNTTIIFDSIDLKQGTARAIGNQGSDDVMVLATPMSITFVERSGMGNLSFISVFPEYAKDTTDFIAVISRHMTLLTNPSSAQYHGTCKIWQ